MADCCDNFDMLEDQSDSFETWQGLRGPYYTPSVDSEGNLSWTNNGGLPNPPTVNITGPEGPQGEPTQVDDALSETSENPVQNKVITEAINFFVPIQLLNYVPYNRHRTASISSGKNFEVNGNKVICTGEGTSTTYRRFVLFFAEDDDTPGAYTTADLAREAARGYLPKLNLGDGCGVMMMMRLHVIDNRGNPNLPTVSLVTADADVSVISISDASMATGYEYFSLIDVTDAVENGFNLYVTSRSSAVDCGIEFALLPYLQAAAATKATASLMASANKPADDERSVSGLLETEE